MKTYRTNRGFTLVEMAVVLVIVGLMLGGLLMPLSAQMEQRDRSNTKQRLEEIKEALIGFAMLNGRLPCPTTQTDPTDANYGAEDCTTPSIEGYLPWKTLGVPETDAWGTVRTSAASPWVGYWHYRVDSNFANAASLIAMTTTSSADALSIQDNAGNSIITSGNTLAVVFSTGKNLAPDSENADYEPTSGLYQSDVPTPTFDDQLIWISRPLLINRMVMAGKLP